MTAMTTIKVPTEMRDRLARYARERQTTLAGAIDAALRAVDRQAFFDELDRAYASTMADEHARADYETEAAEWLAGPVGIAEDA